MKKSSSFKKIKYYKKRSEQRKTAQKPSVIYFIKETSDHDDSFYVIATSSQLPK